MVSPRKLQIREFLNLYRQSRFHRRFARVRRPSLFGNGLALRGAWFHRCFRFPDLLCIDLRLTQAGEIVADGFFVVQSQMFGISAYEAFVENASGS